MTWSAEELFIRAYAFGAVAAQGVWDLVKGVERITKPKRRTGGFDEDAAAFHPYDTPNPYEPALDDSELIGVRGLLQERYEPGYHPHQAIPDHNGYCKAGIGGGELCDLYETNAIHIASPAASTAGDPSPTHQSGYTPSLGGEGSSADSGIPQPPAGERIDLVVSCAKCNRPVFMVDRALVHADDKTLVLTCGGHRARYDDDDAAAEWIGGAVPVITAVLAEHYPEVSRMSGRVDCNPGTENCPMWKDEQAWRDHVAPILANALAPQPKPAFPETGLDMGARLDGASEFYPQHRKTK